ncbi:hypothetical protein HID58_080806 [Brassica napus]|uniref:Peptidase C1A papain C-terminal domain-containing protein n=2 Tax=Brassica napus TaxID=3708 RepID=A0ABQ7Y935_BRANA|nr:uncharacterized protein LOC106375247 [Brassica napus]KAH0863595.1 hypothetical protein HID58_080806 [Brassica napus]
MVDSEYVYVPVRPDLRRLPKHISSRLKKNLFTEITSKQLKQFLDGSEFKKAEGTTRKGLFKLSDNGKILMLFWQLEPTHQARKQLYKELVELDLWEKLSGPIRDQIKHILCWAYSSTDLVSALRCIRLLDDDFVPLSTWYLHSHVHPEKIGNDPTALTGHSCYATNTREAFKFMLNHGGVPKERDVEFDCNEDHPADPEPNITINSYLTFDTLEEALAQLRKQPIGASLLEFSELWNLKKDAIYYGPTEADSYLLGYHGVDIVDIQFYNNEVVALCKFSNGTHVGRDGYFRVSLGTRYMMIGCDEKSAETVRPTPTPEPLLCNFIFPVIHETPKPEGEGEGEAEKQELKRKRGEPTHERKRRCTPKRQNLRRRRPFHDHGDKKKKQISG